MTMKGQGHWIQTQPHKVKVKVKQCHFKVIYLGLRVTLRVVHVQRKDFQHQEVTSLNLLTSEATPIPIQLLKQTPDLRNQDLMPKSRNGGL